MEFFSATYSSPVGNLLLTCSNTHLVSLAYAPVTDQVLNTGITPHPLLQKTIMQLSQYFEGARTVFDLPLQQKGTEFQQAVWLLLCAIPYGTTISYRQLSRQWGDVKAIRAVASANGKNNLPIIIPCHRVIGANRSLTGYSGGLGRKKWLLNHESGTPQLF
ncbi:MAG: methylated-DNA--[protein]-cysteine S-methyltransferase [Chitinophagaceae bacterium]